MVQQGEFFKAAECHLSEKNYLVFAEMISKLIEEQTHGDD